MGKNIFVDKTTNAKFVTTNKKVFDPVGFAGYKKLWHRGYPLEMINKRKYSVKTKKSFVPKVQASFWNGDPDIDAIARILSHLGHEVEKEYYVIDAGRQINILACSIFLRKFNFFTNQQTNYF